MITIIITILIYSTICYLKILNFNQFYVNFRVYRLHRNALEHGPLQPLGQMKKTTTSVLLGLAVGILVLNHLSSGISSPETDWETTPPTTQKHATSLWTAEIMDEKIHFQSSGTEIFTLHLPPYSNPVSYTHLRAHET